MVEPEQRDVSGSHLALLIRDMVNVAPCPADRCTQPWLCNELIKFKKITKKRRWGVLDVCDDGNANRYKVQPCNIDMRRCGGGGGGGEGEGERIGWLQARLRWGEGGMFRQSKAALSTRDDAPTQSTVKFLSPAR